MDRITGPTTIDIGNGRLGFRNRDAVAGIKGTEVKGNWLNAIQEEIMAVIEAAGLQPDPNDWTQLLEALSILIVSGRPFASLQEVVAAAIADRVISPATIAPAVQGGSWNYAVASGTANALTASLTPALEAYTPGLEIRFVPSAVNTDSATLKVGSLAALPIVRNGGYPLRAGDLKAGRLSIGHVSADATVIELVANNQDIPPPGSGLTGSQNYIGWSPAAAASRDLTATFTAPSTGLVLAISTLNKSVLSTENRNVVNTIYINGVQGPGDGVNSGSTVIMTTTATPGQPFTIISRITVDAGGSSAMSNYLTYLFIPA